MLFAKKKAGAPSAPSAMPTGLFVDRDARATDDSSQVIDMPAVEVEDAVEVAPAPVAEAPRASSGFGALRVKKAVAASPDGDVDAAKPTATKVAGLSGLRARFASKKPTEAAVDATAAAENSPEPAKATSKPLKAAKPIKEAKAKKVAHAKPAKFGGKAEKRLVLLTELDNGRNLYWTLEADKLSQTEDVPAGTAVYSFSKEDFRFRAEGALTYRQANDLALQEVGEAVQVVNRTKDLSAVYATRQERALDGKHMIAPAQQALDRLLVERKKTGQPLICGFHFKDAADDSSVAVLFHIGIDGEASKPQISVNPDSMEFVIAQFSASRKVDKTATEVVLFDNAEFLTAIAGAVPFPNEPVWRGVPVRQVLVRVAAAAMVVSVGLGGWAAVQYQQVRSLSATQNRLTGQVTEAKRAIDQQIERSVPAFARAMSLDEVKLFQRAESLYLPDTKLSMVANLTEVRYTYTLPVVRQLSFNNKPSVLNPITPEQHLQFVNFKAPEGCTASPISATGALNETKLILTCETGVASFRSYRND